MLIVRGVFTLNVACFTDHVPGVRNKDYASGVRAKKHVPGGQNIKANKYYIQNKQSIYIYINMKNV